jgi:hypothetical protein
MRAPAPAQWIRILGYAGTALLITAAVAVLMVQATKQTKAGGGTGGGSAAAPSGGRSADPGQGQGQAQADGTGQQQQRPPGSSLGGGLSGVTQCAGSTAGYRRAGNTLKVSVTLPASGMVSAQVQVKGEIEPQIKSVDAAGEQSPHIFEFDNVPAASTQSIAVSVMTSSAFKTCTLP